MTKLSPACQGVKGGVQSEEVRRLTLGGGGGRGVSPRGLGG